MVTNDNKINEYTKLDLVKAKEALLKHGVVAFPTETVMGLGVIFDDIQAYTKLNQIKQRPEDKPYTMMVGDISWIKRYTIITPLINKIINAFMPGPLTIIIPCKENSIPNYVTHNTKYIGFRCPQNKVALDLLNIVNQPLLVPSANKSGEKPANDSDEVKKVFKDEVDYIIPGKAIGEIPSTIIMIDEQDNIKLIRKGPISEEEIYKVLRRKETMRIAVGCDHGGFEYKEAVLKYLTSKNYEVIDCGTNSKESCDYPIFGKKVAALVSEKKVDFGIVICTSGEGIMMTANKVKDVRCGLGYNDDVSRLIRQHNNANMISFGQNFMKLDDILKRIDIFLSTPFEGGRHQRRVDLIEK